MAGEEFGANFQRLAVMGELAGEAAHELRNALAVIAVSAPLLRGAPTEQREVLVARIERNARLAQGVLDALMALARGDEVVREPGSLLDVLQEARREVRGSLTYDDEGVDLALQASPLLLARLFRVLYENAADAKATHVTTRARLEGGRAVVEVIDDGEGVPDAVRAELFTPLATTKPEGTGLGLALARRVARAHGGDVTHHARIGAPGSCFRVELRW